MNIKLSFWQTYSKPTSSARLAWLTIQVLKYREKERRKTKRARSACKSRGYVRKLGEERTLAQALSI